MKTVKSCELNKGFGSKFLEGDYDKRHVKKDGVYIQQLKCRGHYNQDRDNHLNCVNNVNKLWLVIKNGYFTTMWNLRKCRTKKVNCH